jgi:hypothetical protein
MAADDSGYASVVRWRPPSSRWPLVFLVVLAVLFAPAGEDDSSGSVPEAEGSVGARVLAPAVREGILATGPKSAARLPHPADQRSGQALIPLTLASAAAVLLLVFLTWFARLDSRVAPRLVALRVTVPRAPPALQTA